MGQKLPWAHFSAMSGLPEAEIQRRSRKYPFSATRRHSHLQQISPLFDHLVGAGGQRCRRGERERS
jgi:hypothetical protein